MNECHISINETMSVVSVTESAHLYGANEFTLVFSDMIASHGSIFF